MKLMIFLEESKQMTTFDKNEFFCAECLIHDSFFKGGGSWSPDSCPKCKRADNVVPFKKLTIEQKATAIRKFDKMWKEKWNMG